MCTWHRAHFQSCSSLSLESSLISEHIALLERQQPIEVRSSMDFICLQHWLLNVREGCTFLDVAILCW